MPRPVSVTRFERKLRAILGFSGSSLLQGVEDHIAGLVLLEGERPEWDWPGGEIIWTTFANIAAVVAETAYAVLWNPPSSGTLQIVETWDDSGGTGASWFWTITDPATNAGFVADNIVVRDARAAPSPGSFVSAIAARWYRGTLTAAEVGAYGISTMFLAKTSILSGRANKTVIVPPGVGFGFQMGAANAQVFVEVSGRQHPLEGGLLS